MNNKIVKFSQLAELGEGSFEITDFSVNISISGINGALKAWLIGGEAVPIGNIVSGKLYKNIDTTKHSGILITQSGRQILIGYYADDISENNFPLDIKEVIWQKINSKSFPSTSDAVKYILSNKPVYDCFKKYGFYWVGKCNEYEIIALPCNQNENPLVFLGNKSIIHNGYQIVCVDDKNKKIFQPKIS